MTAQTLSSDIANIRRWHGINLGNGIVTPGLDDSLGKLSFIQLPSDLRRKSVLDIGAWDGFFSFEAERRGATRVVAVDTFVWQGKKASQRMATNWPIAF